MSKKRTTTHKRTDLGQPVWLQNLEQADQALAEIAQLRRNINAIETDKKLSILQIRKVADQFTQPRRARLKRLIISLMKFTERHQATNSSGKQQPISTPSGTFGLRNSTKTRPKAPCKWKTVLKRIHTNGFQDAIRVHRKINRKRLHEWPDCQLEKVGVERIEEECFWYNLQ